MHQIVNYICPLTYMSAPSSHKLTAIPRQLLSFRVSKNAFVSILTCWIVDTDMVASTSVGSSPSFKWIWSYFVTLTIMKHTLCLQWLVRMKEEFQATSGENLYIREKGPPHIQVECVWALLNHRLPFFTLYTDTYVPTPLHTHTYTHRCTHAHTGTHRHSRITYADIQQKHRHMDTINWPMPMQCAHCLLCINKCQTKDTACQAKRISLHVKPFLVDVGGRVYVSVCVRVCVRVCVCVYMFHWVVHYTDGLLSSFALTFFPLSYIVAQSILYNFMF